jgi:hypothetical protein
VPSISVVPALSGVTKMHDCCPVQPAVHLTDGGHVGTAQPALARPVLRDLDHADAVDGAADHLDLLDPAVVVDPQDLAVDGPVLSVPVRAQDVVTDGLGAGATGGQRDEHQGDQGARPQGRSA